MQTERLIGAVRDALPGLRRAPDPAITAGADHAKDQRRVIARRLGIEKEIVIAKASRPSIGSTRTI
jgi:hypothetical protein